MIIHQDQPVMIENVQTNPLYRDVNMDVNIFYTNIKNAELYD